MERYMFGSYPIDETRENIPWLVLEKQGISDEADF